jgi:hypothetical protein
MNFHGIDIKSGRDVCFTYFDDERCLKNELGDVVSFPDFHSASICVETFSGWHSLEAFIGVPTPMVSKDNIHETYEVMNCLTMRPPDTAVCWQAMPDNLKMSADELLENIKKDFV